MLIGNNMWYDFFEPYNLPSKLLTSKVKVKVKMKRFTFNGLDLDICGQGHDSKQYLKGFSSLIVY